MTEPSCEPLAVGLIWAQAANGVIGVEGRLPWHLPEDLARFRDLTLGCTVVMGRTTWESLPEKARPLPGRRNVVLTRQPGWRAGGAAIASSLAAALEESPGDIWVIGGAGLYRDALAYADRVEVTELAASFDGDVVAPRLDAEWRQTARRPQTGWLRSRAGLSYRTVSYTRARAVPPAAGAAMGDLSGPAG